MHGQPCQCIGNCLRSIFAPEAIAYALAGIGTTDPRPVFVACRVDSSSVPRTYADLHAGEPRTLQPPASIDCIRMTRAEAAIPNLNERTCRVASLSVVHVTLGLG